VCANHKSFYGALQSLEATFVLIRNGGSGFSLAKILFERIDAAMNATPREIKFYDEAYIASRYAVGRQKLQEYFLTPTNEHARYVGYLTIDTLIGNYRPANCPGCTRRDNWCVKPPAPYVPPITLDMSEDDLAKTTSCLNGDGTKKLLRMRLQDLKALVVTPRPKTSALRKKLANRILYRLHSVDQVIKHISMEEISSSKDRTPGKSYKALQQAVRLYVKRGLQKTQVVALQGSITRFRGLIGRPADYWACLP